MTIFQHLKLALTALLGIAMLGGCQTAPTPARFTAAQVEVLRDHRFVDTGDGWELSMADRLLFDTDSALLRPEFNTALDRIADGLLRVGIDGARVEGHTDSTGSSDHNARLSAARAAAIAAALIDHGFAPTRVAQHGWGETRPVAENNDPEGRQLNRRVVIIVTAG